MLSAVRAMSRRVAHDLAHMDTQRLGPDSTADEQDELLAQVLENALEAGKEAVERGPEQLAVLREAGVVDAGAYGLTVIVAGCLAALRGSAAPELEHQLAPAALHRPEHESSSFRFCTNFAVTGAGLVAGSFVPSLEAIGRLRAGGGRRAHHQGPPAHRRPGARRRGVRRRGRGLALRRRRHARPGGRAHGAAGRAGARLAGHLHGRRRGQRRGRAAPLRGAGRARRGRRRHHEPVHVRAARGRPRRRRRGGARAAEQPQRDPGRRAGGRPVRQARARGAHHGPAGGARGPAGVRSGQRRRRERRGRGPRRRRPARGRCGARRARRRPRPVRRRRGAWATRAASWWPGEIPSARSRPPSSGSPAEASCVTCLAGAGAPLDREWIEAHVPDGVEVEYHEGGQPAWWWLLCAE